MLMLIIHLKLKLNQMSQYRNNGASPATKRPINFKSPSVHQPIDLKTYKKKYQKKLQELIKQRQRTQQLQQMIEQMSKKLQKQQRQLTKKQQIEDVLLQQITQLKTELQESRSIKTSSKQNSLQQKRSLGKKSYEYSNQSNNTSEFSYSGRGESKVNGYNFTLSDPTQRQNNTFQSDYSKNSHQQSSSSMKSYETQTLSDQSDSKVGGYFASIFSK